jgi:hypothetical protein
MSAKREETRERRLTSLIEECEQWLTLPQFIARPDAQKKPKRVR